MDNERYLTFALGKGRLAKKTMETFEKIGITNDRMFGTVFRNEKECKELLQRILVYTDQIEHTARRYSAWLPPIQCTLSGHQCMMLIQV